MLDYYRIKAPFPNRKAHDEQNFLRFLKEQLKEFSQNTEKKGILKKKCVFFCIIEVTLSDLWGNDPHSLSIRRS